MLTMPRISTVAVIAALLIAGLNCASAGWTAPVAEDVVAAVVSYGEANLDAAAGLIKDAMGEPNLAESSPGMLAALLMAGGHEQVAQALLAAILANQDTAAGSTTGGLFRWYGGEEQPYSYDATLYAVPPLAWSLRNHREGLGEGADRLAEALRQAVRAIRRETVQPEEEAYLMLQAAAYGSAGAALNQPELVAQAVSQIRSWLALVKAHGLPAGHSPTFDAMRLSAILWVQDSSAQPDPVLTQAFRLARADVGMRIWEPGKRLGGAMYRSFRPDYLGNAGIASYALANYFGVGTMARPEPFVMYFLLPAPAEPQAPARLELPYQIDTRANPPAQVATTSTYLAPEFSLGTMTGMLQIRSVPVFIGFPATNTAPSIYSEAHPATGHVSAVQKGGTALCSFSFENIGFGTSKQAYVNFVLGGRPDIEAVHVHGAQWDGNPTGVGQFQTLVLATRGCYVGIAIGRCGTPDVRSEQRVKPGDLHWAGEGPLARLVFKVYGRQDDYTLRQPLHNVRVTVGVHVVPQSQYGSLEEFAFDFSKTRIRNEVERLKERLHDEEETPRPSTGGIIPDPKPKKDLKYRQFIKQTVEMKTTDVVLRFTEDLIAGELLTAAIDGVEAESDYLWSGPGFAYAANDDLAAALAAAGY